MFPWLMKKLLLAFTASSVPTFSKNFQGSVTALCAFDTIYFIFYKVLNWEMPFYTFRSGGRDQFAIGRIALI